MKFVTEDGQEFETMAEAQHHEDNLAVLGELKAKVETFLESEGTNARRSSEYLRIILAWESYKIGEVQHGDLSAVA